MVLYTAITVVLHQTHLVSPTPTPTPTPISHITYHGRERERQGEVHSTTTTPECNQHSLKCPILSTKQQASPHLANQKQSLSRVEASVGCACIRATFLPSALTLSSTLSLSALHPLSPPLDETGVFLSSPLLLLDDKYWTTSTGVSGILAGDSKGDNKGFGGDATEALSRSLLVLLELTEIISRALPPFTPSTILLPHKASFWVYIWWRVCTVACTLCVVVHAILLPYTVYCILCLYCAYYAPV
jgi:hypothetical protein